jgi:hypothetical protein
VDERLYTDKENYITKAQQHERQNENEKYQKQGAVLLEFVRVK